MYYCEYENADMLVSALGTLGTIDKVCYYTGNTGQVKPHINTFSYSQTTYVAIAAQLSSFNSAYLSTSSKATVFRENTNFTCGHSAYDFDYHKEGCTTVELDVFFAQNGNISGIQLSVVTDPDALESDTYATSYTILDDSFLSN